MNNFKKLLLVSSAAAALAFAGGQAVNAQTVAEGREEGGVIVYYIGEDLAQGDHWVSTRTDETEQPGVTYIEDPSLTYGEEVVDVEGSAGTVKVDLYERYSSGQFAGIVEGAPRDAVAAVNRVVRVGTAPVEETQDNPTGEEIGNPSDTTLTPEVVEQNDEISWHAPQQNDSEIRGHIKNDDVEYIEIRKNGVVIATGFVDPDGYFTAELQEAIEYGNDIEIWAFNSDGTRIYAVSDVASVDYVAVAHTPNPIRLEAVHTGRSDIETPANTVQGYTRPYNKVYIRVYDPTRQTYTNEEIVAYADANGFFQFNIGSLAKDGFEVHVTTEDSSGNVTETQVVTINDNSTVEAAVVRRTHTGDRAVTVRSYPYAWVTVELIRDGNVIGNFQTRADGNGLARLDLQGLRLEMDDKINIFADVPGRPSGLHTHYVRLAEDEVRPEAPKVDEVVEGSTILKGTAEAYALVSARWLEDGSLNWTEIFTLADENGNFLFDLFEYGFTTPFRKGVEVLVRAHDNNLNHTTQVVSVMPAGTPTVGTELPIEANPDGGDLVDGDKDDNDEDDKDKDHDKDKDKDKDRKPGKHKPGKKKGGSEDPAELPETGESQSYVIFGAAALSVLAGLGLVAPKFKKEN